MKNIKKLSVFLGIIPILLTSCEGQKKAYCVETCDSPDYPMGQYYQASRKDVLESVHLVALPLNPDKGEDEEYKYPFTWNSVTNTEFFTFEGGLKGKKVLSILKLGENVIKVNITGASEDKEATSGYIKVHFRAFKSYVEETKEAYLYAYVAVGNKTKMLDKDDYKLYCLETSNAEQSASGKCYQARKIHGEKGDDGKYVPGTPQEIIYLINDSNDISWHENISALDISLVDGLEGKTISDVQRINEHVLKVELEGDVDDKAATFGYIRIRRGAFNVTDEKNKDKNLYAYVALGDTSDMVNKPAA